MSSSIFTIRGDNITRMQSAAPETEEQIQHLLAVQPELIGDIAGPLLLIQREQPIGDGLTANRWSLDHLFVTRDAVPVLIEVKRAVDTRLRREVVGQMLDYAANGTAYWTAAALAEAFRQTCLKSKVDADDSLESFLENTRDAEDFWEQVEANLRAGRIKMVFVADRIPPELTRVIEFLDEQMRADVVAVELQWFSSGAGITALLPRVLGISEKARAAKAASRSLPPISVEDWVANTFVSQETCDAALKFVQMMQDCGAGVRLTKAQAALNSVVREDLTAYPFSMRRESGGVIGIHLERLAHAGAYADESDRRELYDRLAELVGPFTSKNLAGIPSFPAVRLLNDDVACKFKAVVQEVFARVIGAASA